MDPHSSISCAQDDAVGIVARTFDAQMQELRMSAASTEAQVRAIFPSTDLLVRTFVLAHDIEVGTGARATQGTSSRLPPEYRRLACYAAASSG